MQHVELPGGARLAVRTWGDRSDGPPLLLLHGLGGDAADWEPVAGGLAEGRYVVAPDLRGHGDSSRAPAYSFELMRDDVIALIGVLDLAPTAVVGHSMGGTVAILVCEQAPELVGRLVLEDSPPPSGRQEIDLPPDEAPEPVPFDWPVVPAILRQCVDVDPRWWDDVGRLAIPTLVVAGGPASHVDQDELVELVGRLPDATLVTVEAGHHVHSAEPAAFLQVVRPFLATPTQG